MIRTCTHCGSKNRVPARHLAHTGRCGTCKQKLAPVSAPIDVDAALFDQITSEATVPVLVDFWAEWCGPCKMIGPVVEELAGDYEGKAVVAKLNVDENPDVTARFGIRSIPTLLVFKGGQIVDKQVGAVPKSVLAQKLEAQVV